MKALGYTVSFLTGVSLLIGMGLGGWGTLLTPVVLFLLMPLVDHVVGRDEGEVLPDAADGTAFDWAVRAWVPAQLVFLGTALLWVTSGTPTPWEWRGIALSTGMVTALGAINPAHELMHRKRALDRAGAEILMTTASYPWFCVEHVSGHHRNVGTPADPATARLGESVYAFLPRTLVGSFTSAWRLEGERTARRGIPWYSWRHRIARYAFDLLLAYALVGGLFGAPGLAFFATQSLVAVLLLEVINYIEHYGLLRDRLPSGRFEAVRPRHSWNATHRISNWWLYNLQRHADHHANASRPYYRLRAMPEAPQLPFSYPVAVLVALVPPLWFRVMDPRVQGLPGGDPVLVESPRG